MRRAAGGGRGRLRAATLGVVLATTLPILLGGLSPAHAEEAPAPSTANLTVTPGPARVVADGTVTVSGAVAAPAGGLLGGLTAVVGTLLEALLRPLAPVAGLPVSLELKTPNGWLALSSARTDAAGHYTLRVPTYFLGSHQWRVNAARTTTSVATPSAPFSLSVGPGYAPTGSARSFKLLADAGARWNPCEAVPYYVNRAGMPRGALGVIAAALRQVREASGITFRYAGATRSVPFGARSARNGLPTAGITIAWSTPRTVTELRGSTIAVAGSSTRVTQRGPADFRRQYFAGGLVVDRTERVATRMGRGRTLGYVIMHEMGHVLGLAHVRDGSQVMGPFLNSRSYTRYGAGDLAGFAAVGLGKGCV